MNTHTCYWNFGVSFWQTNMNLNIKVPLSCQFYAWRKGFGFASKTKGAIFAIFTEDSCNATEVQVLRNMNLKQLDKYI